MTLTVATLMWPNAPPLDVRIQDRVTALQSRRLDRTFPHIKALPLSVGLAGFFGALAATSWATEDERLLEYDSLMVEAMLVSQIYVGIGKALIGRDSPYRDASGDVHGPRLEVRGTPSGHMATMYSLLAVTAWYWHRPWLHVLTHAIAIWFGMGLVYNQQHFVSDVLFGAGIGYYVGRWVVRHRTERVGSRVPGAILVPFWGEGRVGLSLIGQLQ